MAIKKQFGGQTLLKPGAYSRSQTSPDGGSASATTGVMLLIGEADAGPSSAEEGMQRFSAAAFNQLKAKYRTGPLVDAAKAALAPSRTPGVNGVGTFLVWKTNQSLQAAWSLANGYGTVYAREWSLGGNRCTYKNTLSAESAIQVDGAQAVVTFPSLNNKTLILRKNGGPATTITFSSPTDINDVVSQINSAVTGITASSVGGALRLTMDAGTDLHRNGWGRSFEIEGGTSLNDLWLMAAPLLATPAEEPKASITLTQPRDSIVETDIVGGDIVLQIGRDDSNSITSAAVTVSETNIVLDENGAPTVTIDFTNAPLLGNMADLINGIPGWTASVPAAMRNVPCTELDIVEDVGAFSLNLFKPARLKRDRAATKEFFANSSLESLDTSAAAGLPDQESQRNLNNGDTGASASSDFDAGLSAALGEDLNIIVPCISQDAADDILAGVTDASSSYDIETVHAMLDTHLRLRGSIKNRKEAQGVVGYRKQAKADAFEQAAKLGSELIQLCMEDVLVVDSSNSLKWKHPHIMAAMVAGMRMGTPIGEPLTHKYLAVQGLGHFVNPSTGKVMGDYNSLTDYEEAIAAGVTSAEPAAGGWRVMVDNTTYGADENFVWNRGSVVEAAQYTAKTIRADAEAAFVGRKNSVVTAESIKNRIRSKLTELFKGQVLSPSDDAPMGFREDTFIVQVTGNTAEVFVEVKPVQGIDFVLINFTLGETKQTA
jgi:hypothetical protein